MHFVILTLSIGRKLHTCSYIFKISLICKYYAWLLISRTGTQSWSCFSFGCHTFLRDSVTQTFFSGQNDAHSQRSIDWILLLALSDVAMRGVSYQKRINYNCQHPRNVKFHCLKKSGSYVTALVRSRMNGLKPFEKKMEQTTEKKDPLAPKRQMELQAYQSCHTKGWCRLNTTRAFIRSFLIRFVVIYPALAGVSGYNKARFNASHHH